MRAIVPAALVMAATFAFAPDAALAAGACGDVVTIKTHGRSTTRYAVAQPGAAAKDKIALVLLVGGGGHLNLDDNGCPRALRGNFMVRAAPHFRSEGFVTVLVDAPSDHPGRFGLKTFRVTCQHADDLGKVIADIRGRVGGPV